MGDLMQVSLGGALDQSVRDELADPNAVVLVAENTRQTKVGARTKRYGYAALTRDRITGSDRSAGHRMFPHGKSIGVIDGTYLDTYDANLTSNATHGKVPEVACETFSIASMSFAGTLRAGPSTLDLAYANGMYFVSVVENLGSSTAQINVYVVNATTRATIKVLPITAPTGVLTTTKLVTVGNTLVCIYEAGANSIAARTVSVASASSIDSEFSAATTLVTDAATVATHASSGPSFDACGGATMFFLAYVNNVAAAASLTVSSFNTSLAIQTTKTNTNTTAQIEHVAIDGSESDNIWVAWARPTAATVVAQGLDPTNLDTVTATPATVLTAVTNAPYRLGLKRTSASGGVCVATGRGAIWYALMSRTFTVSAGAVTATDAQIDLWGWEPTTQPAYSGSTIYCLGGAAAETSATGNVCLFDTTLETWCQRPVAVPLRGSNFYFVTNGRSSHTVTVSATRFASVGTILRTPTAGAIVIYEFDTAATHRWNTAQHNGCTYLSSGCNYGFDGTQLFEAGFVEPPAIRANIVALAGNINNGVHIYAAIYEWTDSEGNTHWSEPSTVKSVTASAGNQQADIDIKAFGATWKDGTDGGTVAPSRIMPRQARRVRARLYRTTAGASAPFYFLAEVVLTPDGTGGAGYFTVRDDASDATISVGAQLYTSPGNVGVAQYRRCPPSFVDITTYNEMVVGIADDRRTLWHSAAPVVGEGAWWADVWQYPLGEDLVALAAMDGTLFVFARRGIYALTAEPPSENGQSGGFGTPRKLATDDGCTDPRSVVVTSRGIFFLSEDGLRLLSRAQQVEPIGSAVFSTTDSFPYCMSAIVDPSESVVYFELASSQSGGLVSGTGRSLVYDLQLGQWESTDRRASALGAEDTPAQSSAFVYTGSAWRYAWLDTEGRVYVEDKTSYLDSSAWVVMKVVSAWFKPAGLQGLMQPLSVTFLGRRATDHTLLMALGYDYNTSLKSATTYSRATIATVIAALNGGQEQLYHECHDEAGMCEAICVAVYDAAPSGGTVGSGQGATFVGLTLDAVPKPGTYLLPAEAG